MGGQLVRVNGMLEVLLIAVLILSALLSGVALLRVAQRLAGRRS